MIEWKADDSPISFETSLFAVLYYIKPNQLSQKAACYNNRELGGHFLTEEAGCKNPNMPCAITAMRALKSCN